jgi:hypothetical protein
MRHLPTKADKPTNGPRYAEVRDEEKKRGGDTTFGGEQEGCGSRNLTIPPEDR